MGHGVSTLCSLVETKDQSQSKPLDSPTTKSATNKEQDLRNAERTVPDGEKQEMPGNNEDQGDADAKDCSNQSRTSQTESNFCCETNQHAHDNHDHTIPPVGDLGVSQISGEDLRAGILLNGTGNYVILKSNTPSEIDKVNLTWSEKNQTDSRPSASVEPQALPEITSKAGDLNAKLIRTDQPRTSCRQTDIPTDISNAISGLGELPAKDDSYDNISKTDNPQSEDLKFPKVMDNSFASDDREKKDERREAPAVEKTEHNDSPGVPMSPDDFATHKTNSKHPPLTTIKLPEISEIGNAVRQAITVKSPTVSHRQIDNYDDQDNTIISESPANNGSLSRKPRGQPHQNTPVLVNRHISRFVRTRDTGTLVLTEKVDAQTSMYVCAENSQSGSQYIIPEIADSTTVSDAQSTLNSKTIEREQQESIISGRRPSRMEKALRLSKQIPLSSVKPDKTTQSKQDDHSIPVSKINTESENSLLSDSEEPGDQNKQFEQSHYPSATVEKFISYTDPSTECQIRFQSMPDVDEPVSKYCTAGVQTETVIIVDDDYYSTDGPYNVDKTRESILRTPTLEEGKIRQPGVVDSLIDEDPSTKPIIFAADNNTLHPTTFDITPNVSRKQSSEQAQKSEESIPYELNQAAVSRNIDTNSSVQVELSFHEKDSSENADNRSNQDTLYNSTRRISPEADRGSLELTDFLQVLQSTDDFEILAEDSTSIEKPDIPQLKAGIKETPRSINMTNGDGNKKSSAVGQKKQSAVRGQVANKNKNNQMDDSEEG
ncbi:hypothetical protein D915_006650 [Fasciola hepatica]|uniref:Uncharacterized protein n=1 Tax=Fasciola hepatica TaxID=6192 RepID=A0A2H1C6F1_FASHE|nr:hypothetical protein D915_006650 [Fasciola hepatica]